MDILRQIFKRLLFFALSIFSTLKFIEVDTVVLISILF